MTPTTPGPTPTQLELLRAIAAVWDRHGYAPTRRELADELACQPSNVQQTLARLSRDGWIADQPLQPRTLRLTPAAVELLGRDATTNRG
jgi:DNA-binding MarR family transcriptional regulator